MNEYINQNPRKKPEPTPKFYDILPEYNEKGRLCNYGFGSGDTVRVMADEWDRFCQLAGRKHKVVDGIVVFDPELPETEPDIEPVPTAEELAQRIDRQGSDMANLVFALVMEGVI